MNGFARIEIKIPECFGSHEKFSVSPDCTACKSHNECNDSIEIDKLIENIPAYDDDSEMVMEPLRVPASDTSVRETTLNASHRAGVTTTARYTFPTIAQRAHESYSDTALVEALSVLVAHAFQGVAPIGYGAVRTEICAINLEMNLRQRMAPRFRPMRKLVQKPQPGDETDMALDRQVIDLHWRAFSAEKPLAAIQDYNGIFDAPAFDFHLAARFAQEAWKLGAKAVHLNLTEEMQWEHAVIQIQNIRDKWRTLQYGDVTNGTEIKQRGMPQVESVLRTKMRNSPHLSKHIPGLVRVWAARRIVGDHPARIARLESLMSGEKPRDPRAIKRSMRTLDARLASA